MTYALIALFVIAAVLFVRRRPTGDAPPRARADWSRLVGLCHGDTDKAERLVAFEHERRELSREQAIAGAVRRLLEARNR